ncbi:hypothetical protein GWK47_051971 [Chionoecetes opilio]|uniref:Uncharacterized protein n=1 Tax=Chionoecetes opilio TaxID=41210 RepID=A0A8J5CSZ0_CHIOP|nr:hypothetical protein GWK47_051971 [Chionoecetes opilio]
MGCVAHPPEGVCPALLARAYADLKEACRKALKLANAAHFRCMGGRSLGLGWARQVVHLLPRLASPDPCLASMSSASTFVLLLTVEQDLAVSSVPHHDRDSQVEDLRMGLWPPTAGQGLLGLPHPHSCASGVVGWCLQ